ncbi:hypothetical protein NDU88_004373 [Pleurodeles waltl]|uniref:Uncharacterized protein n=1 Tax=Pleurodeles waltl TaxID=8319 RepID=A0AAV7V2T9_PLEWA|nr:hypothetical protein NDU88_004373 [Pleurodeles waltl]
MEEGREGVVPGIEELREGMDMEARIGAVVPGMEAWREGAVLSDLGKQVVLSKREEAADCSGDGLALPGGKVVSESFSPGRGETEFQPDPTSARDVAIHGTGLKNASPLTRHVSS